MITLLFVASFAAADVATDGLATQPSFDHAQVAWALTPGDATVKGRASRHLPAGEVNCFREAVQLIPRSAFADYRMALIYGSTVRGEVSEAAIPSSNLPAGYEQSRLKALCGQNGMFKFSNVPSGEYYLTVYVSSLAIEKQGTATSLMRRIFVPKGGMIHIDVAK